MWRPDGSRGRESAKIRWFAAPYLWGRGLDVGCGVEKVFPSAIGIDSGKDHGGRKVADLQIDGARLDLFSDGVFGYVFSSHVLEHLEDWRGALREWWRVLRPGGHLVLYLPHAHHYPRRGMFGANPDHRHDFVPEDVVRAMEGVMEGSGGDVLEDEVRSGADEYSFFQVYRKRGDGVRLYRPWRRRERSCLVIRWGAHGDALMASSILPGLKEAGFTVTVNTGERGEEVLRHDPHIDELVVTPPDLIPAESAGAYWQALGTRCDRMINLSECCEGAILRAPSQPSYYWPDEARRVACRANYVEFLHLVAGVPYKLQQRFHATGEESAWAREVAGPGSSVVWVVAGSAQHKVWPWIAPAIVQLLFRDSRSRVFLVGGQDRADLGRAVSGRVARCCGDHGERLRNLVGEVPIRRSMALAQAATVVVGPETGVLHAVATEPNVKVVLLSHSSSVNLTRDWRNTVAVQPDPGQAPCHPCHRLHHDTEHCPQVEGFAACAWAIPVERVLDPVFQALRGEEAGRPGTQDPALRGAGRTPAACGLAAQAAAVEPTQAEA